MEQQEIQEMRNRVKQRKAEEKRNVSYQLFKIIMANVVSWGMSIEELQKTVRYLERTIEKNEIAMRKSTAISEVDVL